MALIKCPECKKDVSSTINKCPHCGYKIKDNFNLKKILLKNKILFIVVMIFILIIIIGLIINALNGPNSNSRKMKKYLESVGYDCESNKEGYKGKYYCIMITNNGITKEMTIDQNSENALNYQYINTDYNTYKITINSNNYIAKKHQQHITYENLIEDEKYFFFPDENNFYIGEKLEYKTTSRYDKNVHSDVVEAMREFESYFLGAGVNLSKK
ncbi:MAG: zinc ribbon domain-containing protein [Firmicutes bacterium]|nr:zinc ribbon domain-containing protein [Bacillota bacterium]